MSFESMQTQEKTAVLLIAPETGKLPEDMGTLARFISGKSGGLGEVVAALCEGLTERGIECHLATINLKKRFKKECRLDEEQWREATYKLDPDKIHLISSAVFADLPSVYAGDPRLNAAEFQKQMINNVIKAIRGKNAGRLILHSHDWMAGGVITAYIKSRGFPSSTLFIMSTLSRRLISWAIRFGPGERRPARVDFSLGLLLQSATKPQNRYAML